MSLLEAVPTRRGFLGALALCVLILQSGALAAAPPRATLSSADQADLDRIRAYLNGIKTVTGRFQQTNPDGTVATGKIWVSRPGKMRFDYEPPAQLQIICDGNFIEVNDKSLKDIEFAPLEGTPPWLILRDGITLSGDVTVTRFERGPRIFRVTVVQTDDKSNTSLTMVFSDEPLALRQWTVFDPQGQPTTVALTDLQETGTLEHCLFVLPDSEATKRNGTKTCS